MSMDVFFHGIVEPDDEFKKKYDAFIACEKAGIDPPDELWEYFDNERPNPSGLVIRIESTPVRISEYTTACEIDLKSLRSDIGKIQIYMG